MSKGLEALNDARENLEEIDGHVGFDYGFEIREIKDDFIIIEKELKALEIIRKYPMFSLHDDLPAGTYRMYDCELYSHYDLTQEEYDLLKEVLL